MESLESNIRWVKVIYSDSSNIVFRGTRNLAIINSFTNVNVIDENEIYDVNREKMRYFGPECEVQVFSLKPDFERRVDEFANQFI